MSVLQPLTSPLVGTAMVAWIPFLEPMPGASSYWWTYLLPLALFLSMAWKAVRLPKLDHYWRDVLSMTGQILAAVVALAIGLYVLVIVVMPRLPAE
jgi:hypothetical protein